jgi:hypothetical protein
VEVRSSSGDVMWQVTTELQGDGHKGVCDQCLQGR